MTLTVAAAGEHIKVQESSLNPLSGLWKPTQLVRLHYGSGSVNEHLLECLPLLQSKAFIVTGSSLAQKTPLIRQVEELLGARHAGTFDRIRAHAPIKELDEAVKEVLSMADVDTVISIGGGSPIDSAKVISYRSKERSGRYLYHISIPTTLGAAETTMGAAFTTETGLKTAFVQPELAPEVVIYDSTFALHTPEQLFLSTAIRSVDHAMELMYHPSVSEMPAKQLCLMAASDFFVYLPRYKQNPKDEQVITRLQLASFASLGFMGYNFKGNLGLSHALGYALGSPYGIPHGVTSCLTLGHVVKLKAQTSAEDASQIARMAPFIGLTRTDDAKTDAISVGDTILQLVDQLGLKTTLTKLGVGKDQVATIVKTATRTESGPLYDAVTNLVEGLY